MDLRASLLGDWRSWDGLVPVQYESARRPVNDPTALAAPDPNKVLPIQAKPRPLTQREKAASGGAYVGAERYWLVPVQQLPEGFECKPADVIRDAKGTRYTVLEGELNAVATFYRLRTISLVLAFDLRDSVQIERATISYDASGAAVKTFPPAGGTVLYDKLAARVQLVTDEIQDTRGQRSFVGTHAVTVGRQVAVTNEDRVKWADPGGVTRYLDIKGLHNPARIDELPVIDALLNP